MFLEIEHNIVLSREQIRAEFELAKLENPNGEYPDDFEDYLDNCHPVNGGILKPLDTRYCIVVRSNYDGILTVKLVSDYHNTVREMQDMFDDDLEEARNLGILSGYDDTSEDIKSMSYCSSDIITYTVEEVQD